ncbi:MAG: DotA/TraY family protein [Polaromonas sp.]|nr:DotA/TraY family protein [Polaromonas sp.]
MFSMSKQRQLMLHIRYLMLCSLLATAFVPLMAHAAPAPDFEPGANDLTVWLLKSVFGDWTSDTPAPMLGPAMQVFNLFVVGFGVLMFSYMAIIGTLNSAQDGEVLGKKWNSMWIVVRFTAGIALMVPLANGYSPIQVFILKMANLGGGAASAVWRPAIQGFGATSAQIVINGNDYVAKVEELMREVLKAEVCNAQMSATYAQPYGITTEPVQGRPVLGRSGVPVTNGFNQVSFKWGGGSESSGQPVDACGSALTSKFNFPASGDPSLRSASSSFTNVYNAPTAQSEGARQQLIARGNSYVAAQAQGISAGASAMRSLAQRIAVPNPSQPVTRQQIIDGIRAGARAYISTTASPTSALVSSYLVELETFTNNSVDMGWMMAGASFFQAARIRSEASSITQSVPVMTAGTQQANSNLADVTTAAITNDLESMNAMIDQNFQGDTGDSMNLGDGLAKAAGKAFSVDPANPKHVLVQIKDTGDTLLVASEAAAVSTVIAATVSTSAANGGPGRLVSVFGPNLGEGLKTLISMVTPALYIGLLSLFSVAVTMAFILPLMPFTLMIGSIVGWIMAVFSAVIAAPVWMAGHLHPEGDGIAGAHARGGYMLLIETVTRPLFIVFGLIGAFLLMDPVVRLVAMLFRITMSSLQGDSITGLVSILVLAILYCVIVFTTVKSAATLIHVLSESAYRWIGGQFAGMEQAGSFGRDAHATSSAATGGARSMAMAGEKGFRTHVKNKTSEAKPKDDPAKNQASA